MSSKHNGRARNASISVGEQKAKPKLINRVMLDAQRGRLVLVLWGVEHLRL